MFALQFFTLLLARFAFGTNDNPELVLPDFDDAFSSSFLDACEQQLEPRNMNLPAGVYSLQIAQAFPSINGKQPVHAFGPKRNLFCVCVSVMKMECTITVHKDSDAWTAVTGKLNGSTDDMKPFYVWENNQRAFSTNGNVIAIISVDVRDSLIVKPIRKSLCDVGSEKVPSCPISFHEFQDGDVVYVIKGSEGTDDLEKTPPKVVYCISFASMQTWAQAHSGGRFQDPLRRRSQKMLTLASYERRVITPDKDFPSASSSSSTNADAATSDLADHLSSISLPEQHVQVQQTSSNFSNIQLQLFFFFFIFFAFYISFFYKSTPSDDIYIHFPV